MNDLTKDELRQRAESAQAAGDKWFTADTQAVLGLVVENAALKQKMFDESAAMVGIVQVKYPQALAELADWKARALKSELAWKPVAKVDQTIAHSETTKGNCMQAAVASLLHLPIEAVPHFAESGDAYTCWTSFEDWLNARGYEVWLMPTKMMPDCPYLASGPTIRGTSHMVVMQGAKLLHDPHPSRTGLIKVEQARVLLPKSYATPQPAAQEPTSAVTVVEACKGKNCGSTNSKLHSAECFAEHDKTVGDSAESRALTVLLCEIDTQCGNGMMPWQIEDAYANYAAAIAAGQKFIKENGK